MPYTRTSRRLANLQVCYAACPEGAQLHADGCLAPSQCTPALPAPGRHAPYTRTSRRLADLQVGCTACPQGAQLHADGCLAPCECTPTLPAPGYHAPHAHPPAPGRPAGMLRCLPRRHCSCMLTAAAADAASTMQQQHIMGALRLKHAPPAVARSPVCGLTCLTRAIAGLRGYACCHPSRLVQSLDSPAAGALHEVVRRLWPSVPAFLWQQGAAMLSGFSDLPCLQSQQGPSTACATIAQSRWLHAQSRWLECTKLEAPCRSWRGGCGHSTCSLWHRAQPRCQRGPSIFLPLMQTGRPAGAGKAAVAAVPASCGTGHSCTVRGGSDQYSCASSDRDPSLPDAGCSPTHSAA